MQRTKSMTRSDLREAVLAFIILIAIIAASGCASVPEPVWKPEPKVYVADPTGPVFVGADKVPLSCTDPLMHDYVLISLEKLATLQDKIQRCGKWK